MDDKPKYEHIGYVTIDGEVYEHGRYKTGWAKRYDPKTCEWVDAPEIPATLNRQLRRAMQLIERI